MVTITRIRQRTFELISEKTEEEKYIVFIDHKAAYASVNHPKLFTKLEGMGYPMS